MNPPTQTIIGIGEHFPISSQDAIDQSHAIPRQYFRDLAEGRFSHFSFLADISFSDAFNFVKGLVVCEEARICPYPGSTSLVIWAFNAIQRRPIEEWATVAVWVVRHHQNPYSPFNFRRTRDHWETAMRQSDAPLEIAARARELEMAYESHKRATAAKQAIREHIAHLNKETAPESLEIRQQIIEELEKEAGWPEER